MNETQNNQPTHYLDALDAWLRYGSDRITKEQRAMLLATDDQQHRQQGTTPASAGGFLTNPEFFDEVMQRLDARSGLRGFARSITTRTGSDMLVPGLNDNANDGEAVAEQGPISEQALVFLQAVLGAEKFTSGEVAMSFELLQDALISVPTFLAEVFAMRIGRAQSDAFTANLLGTVADTTGAGATPTSEELLALFYAVRPDYREHASTGWLMSDVTAIALRDISAGDLAIPWWQPGASASEPDRLLGKPVYVNNSMPDPGVGNTSIVFGAGELGFFIRDVRGMAVQRLDELKATSGQVSFVGWLRSDGAQVDSDALAAFTGGP